MLQWLIIKMLQYDCDYQCCNDCDYQSVAILIAIIMIIKLHPTSPRALQLHRNLVTSLNRYLDKIRAQIPEPKILQVRYVATGLIIGSTHLIICSLHVPSRKVVFLCCNSRKICFWLMIASTTWEWDSQVLVTAWEWDSQVLVTAWEWDSPLLHVVTAWESC